MRVLQEQQRVGNRSGLALLDQDTLQGQGFVVGHYAQAPDDELPARERWRRTKGWDVHDTAPRPLDLVRVEALDRAFQVGHELVGHGAIHEA
ncbi:MAG TPA: hypothetical protein VMW48_08395, partial [Vicinamibacterales bacterium]|nr:hypothetical protein [Vicinamibacterales bacterium]